MTERPSDRSRADSASGESSFLADLIRESRREAERNSYRADWTDALSGSFLSFLQTASRFDVFSFGPISIYVPAVRAVINDAMEDGRSFGGDYARFTVLAEEERKRAGASELSELHVLLAFMKLGEGLPAKVFGELGVGPEQVEEFARAGTARTADLERLYSPEEAAAYLNVHVETIREWIRTGRLRASRLAGRRALRIKASDLSAVLEPVEPTGSGDNEE